MTVVAVEAFAGLPCGDDGIRRSYLGQKSWSGRCLTPMVGDLEEGYGSKGFKEFLFLVFGVTSK